MERVEHMTSLETATRNLKRKFRKVANNALPELLAIGTGELARGRLDGAINALDKKLCKAAAQEYRKVVAAAIVEKRRSMASQAAVPITKASYGERTDRCVEDDDLDDDGDTPKGEAITGKDASDKSRKKAKKERRRAEEAAAAAAGARDRLNKAADVDAIIGVAKSIIAGQPTAFTKRDFFLEIQKRADQQRGPGETRERAFARYATTDPQGRLLFQAHKAADGVDYTGELDEADEKPVTNEAYRRLMKLAADNRSDGETLEQSFARLYADPKYRDLVATEKRMHAERVTKVLGLG